MQLRGECRRNIDLISRQVLIPALLEKILDYESIYQFMLKELRTDYVHFMIREGLLIATYKEGLKINLSIAEEIVSKRLQFTEGQLYPVLIYNLGVISIDKSARDFFSSAAGTKAVEVAAIITDSAYKAALTNFFLRVTRPPIRVRMFQSDSRARIWLQQYNHQNNL